MTRQQAWARQAFGYVLDKKGHEQEKKYRTLCMKAAGLIQQSGLVQALAFLRAREGEMGKALVNELAAVYRQTPLGEQLGQELFEAASTANALSEYMAMTQDLIDVAIWFRRFAQAELKSEDNPT